MNLLSGLTEIEVSKLQKYGVDISDADFSVYMDSQKTLKQLRLLNPDEYKEKIAKVLSECCMTYLSIDSGSTANVTVLAEIIRSLTLEFGDKLTIVQVKHAFNLYGRSKIDIDLNMYGKLSFKPIMDLFRLYCGKKHKVVSAANAESRKQLAEPTLSKEQGAKYLFEKWEESNKDGFLHKANKLYAVSFGKNFINYGLVNVTEERQKQIYDALRNFEIKKTTEIVLPCGESEDGVILYEKQKVQVPLQHHESYKDLTFDDLFTYLVLFEHWKNENS